MRPEDLDTGTLALFVGFAAAAAVQDELAALGLGDLRFSHGYVFQHLIEGEPTIGELAAKLGLTQQAASKSIAELERLGYTERVPDPADARARRVRLTARGHHAITTTRQLRAALENRLTETCGQDRLSEARSVLTELLDALGGTAAVRHRQIRSPR